VTEGGYRWVLNDDCGARNEVQHQLRRESKDLLTLPIFCHLYLHIPHRTPDLDRLKLSECFGTSRPSFGDTLKYQDRYRSHPFAQQPPPHSHDNGRAIDGVRVGLLQLVSSHILEEKISANPPAGSHGSSTPKAMYDFEHIDSDMS
jgi:hypothetical protein